MPTTDDRQLPIVYQLALTENELYYLLAAWVVTHDCRKMLDDGARDVRTITANAVRLSDSVTRATTIATREECDMSLYEKLDKLLEAIRPRR